jgi:YycE-like N-terminal domain
MDIGGVKERSAVRERAANADLPHSVDRPVLLLTGSTHRPEALPARREAHSDTIDRAHAFVDRDACLDRSSSDSVDQAGSHCDLSIRTLPCAKRLTAGGMTSELLRFVFSDRRAGRPPPSSHTSLVRPWPEHLPVIATRIARATARLDAVRVFYRDVLGLPELGAFEKHAGYSGVIFGLPDPTVQLEFTAHEAGSPCPAPTRDR